MEKSKTAIPQIFGTNNIPEVSVFEHENFGGREIRTALNIIHLGKLNDAVSSIIIYSGTWEFYYDANFVKPAGKLGKGFYWSVLELGWENDKISSFQLVGP